MRSNTDICKYDVVIDGIFGTDFRGCHGIAGSVIGKINESGAKLSV